MRITAAVYEALRPILNEMSQRVEQFDMRLTALNESLRDDFSGVERGLNSTANVIYDKIENEITTELVRMNQTLKREIILTTLGENMEVHGVGDVQSTWI